MKGIVSVLVIIVGVLSVAALMPAISHASVVNLIPAESQTADPGTSHFIATPSKHYRDVAESQAVDPGGPRVLMSPSKHYKDVAESQEVDATIDTPRAVAKTPWDFWEKSN